MRCRERHSRDNRRFSTIFRPKKTPGRSTLRCPAR
jgi:hypothetical protein